MKKTFLFILFLHQFVFAQHKHIQYAININAANGFVWAHSKVISSVANKKVAGVSIDLYRFRTDEFAKKYYTKGFASGYNLSYYNLGFDTLGKAFSLNYFIEPTLFSGRFFNCNLKAIAGVTYGTNPYNELTNPSNFSYSSHINGFLALGLRMQIPVTTNGAVALQLMYNHFSNGSLKNPNFGVNFPTAEIGYLQKIGSKQKPLKENLQTEKWRIDVYGFVCNKSSPVFKSDRFWVTGGGLQASHRIGIINALTFTSEVIADNSLRRQLDNDTLNHLSSKRLGLLFGHEFIFNRIIFTQQIGWYAYNQIPYFNNLYHRWGVNFKISKRFLPGICLLANAQKAQFLEFRTTVNLYKK